MNFRSTTLLFGLLLGMLWLFGLTVAQKKRSVDASFLLPSLQAHPDVDITSITIERHVTDKKPEEFQFTKETDIWRLKLPNVQKSVKLESFRVQQIVNQIKDARRSDEADVTEKLAFYHLDPPASIITLRGKAPGKPEQEWKFFIGKESADQVMMYVNTSDRPGKVYAINKNNIDSVLFKDPNHLRSRRIFEFSDAAADTVAIKEGSTELELKKGEDQTWRFEKPALGFADFEGPPAPKEAPPGAKPPDGGVKGLLAAISTMRVDSDDDFVPLSDAKLDAYGLEEGKEAMRIEVETHKDKGEKKTSEILAIGAADKSQVFARLVGDQGVFKLNAKLLEPIKRVLQHPGLLRSLDVISIDTKKVDAVTVVRGTDKVIMLRPEGKPWEVQVGTGKLQKANNQAIQGLLDAAEGKRAIVRFYDGDDFKKLDAEMAKPVAAASLFLAGLDQGKKEQKEPANDETKKKPDAKDETPRLKQDAKAAVTLSFGANDAETVNVQRVLADGTTSRFTLPKSVLDRVAPPDITLAFIDTALPGLAADDVDRIVIARDKESTTIERGWGEKAKRWFFKEGQEPPGRSPTDAAKADTLVNTLTGLSAKQWLHKVDPKEDLDKYGLNKPSLEVTLRLRKDRPGAMAILVSVLASPIPWSGLLGEAAVLANRYADPGTTVVLKVGKEAEDKGKLAAYAQRSDENMLFLLPVDVVRMLHDIDLHDLTSVIIAEPLAGATIVGLEGTGTLNALLGGSPLATNVVQNFDAAKVKELKLAIRTREELRVLTFKRDYGPKQKDWRDLSGLQEFNLDSQKVNQAVESLGTLKAGRWVILAGGAKGDQRLTAKEATLRIEATLEDGQSITLTVGAPFVSQESGGSKIGYYAQTSAMPDAVFLLAPSQVEPLLQGPGHFAKERLAAR